MRQYSESKEAVRCRVKRHEKYGRVGEAKCELCGTACRLARKDRFGNRLPTGCSTYCVEILLQKRAKEKA